MFASTSSRPSRSLFVAATALLAASVASVSAADDVVNANNLVACAQGMELDSTGNCVLSETGDLPAKAGLILNNAVNCILGTRWVDTCGACIALNILVNSAADCPCEDDKNAKRPTQLKTRPRKTHRKPSQFKSHKTKPNRLDSKADDRSKSTECGPGWTFDNLLGVCVVVRNEGIDVDATVLLGSGRMVKTRRCTGGQQWDALLRVCVHIVIGGAKDSGDDSEPASKSNALADSRPRKNSNKSFKAQDDKSQDDEDCDDETEKPKKSFKVRPNQANDDDEAPKKKDECKGLWKWDDVLDLCLKIKIDDEGIHYKADAQALKQAVKATATGIIPV